MVYTLGSPKIILLILIGLLSGVLIWILASGVNRRAVLPSSIGLISNADIMMDRFALKQIRDGQVEWDIKAERAELFEDRHEVSMSGMQATLQTNDGFRLSFSGDRGVLNTLTHDFEVMEDQGDMTLEMNNGFTLSTPSLSWRDRPREIVSSQPARITGQGLQIRGEQVMMKLENRQLIVQGDVHVTTEP